MSRNEAGLDNLIARTEYGTCLECKVGEVHVRPERRFPVLGVSGSISWSLAELAYDFYAQKFPSAASLQSLEDIYDRGGFAPEALDSLLPEGYPWLAAYQSRVRR